ncbi:MAG: CBS domain-containing protein [Mycobacterium sp.]
MRIADVLRNKGSEVATISADTPVAELLAGMAEHYIRPMVVMGPDGPIGIVSQPGIVRRLFVQGIDLIRLPVSAFMTTVRVTCAPGDAVDHVGELMIEHRMQHAPVISNGELVGIVTVDDVVKAWREEPKAEQEKLHTPITRG